MDSGADSRGRSERLAYLALALAFVYAAFFIGLTWRWYMDDAFIGLQFLRNLLAGHGFVFRPGSAPVEGVTNVGWLLLLAPLGLAAELPVAAKAAGCVLLLGSLVFVARLGHILRAKVGDEPWAPYLPIVPLLLVLFNFEFLYFSVAGMETALLGVLLLVMATLAVKRPASLALPVLGAYAFLVHPEAVLVFPFYLVGAGRCREVGWRRAVAGLAVFAALVTAATAARLAYFHALVPNTFYAKPSGPATALRNASLCLLGRSASLPFPVSGWLGLLVLLPGYLRLRRSTRPGAAMLCAITATGLVFAVWSRPDWSLMARHFAPYLPATLFLFWPGIALCIQRLLEVGVRPGKAWRVRIAVVLLLVLTGASDHMSKAGAMGSYPGYVMTSETLIQPSRWLAEHLPDGATIATRRIGAVAYYGGHPVFDYCYGLTDREVARLVAARGAIFRDPTDVALAEVWRRRAPDYLLEDDLCLGPLIQRWGASYERFTIHGLTYRLEKRFPLGGGSSWVLARRID